MSGTIESQLRYHAKHPDTPPPLRGLMLRAVEELRYRAMVIEQRNAEIKRGHDDFVQAITDPENQPSQWGTVTLALAQQGEPVCAGCGIPVGDVHMSTCKSGKWPSRVSNGDAPAPMTAKRAAYFMERFKKDEKLLGPNEQAAVAFVLEMLAQQGEPVAYLVYANGSRRYSTLTFDVNKVPEIYIGGEAIPLYTAAPAPQAQPMTDPCKTCSHFKKGNLPGVRIHDETCYECRSYWGNKWEAA